VGEFVEPSGNELLPRHGADRGPQAGIIESARHDLGASQPLPEHTLLRPSSGYGEMVVSGSPSRLEDAIEPVIRKPASSARQGTDPMTASWGVRQSGSLRVPPDVG